MTEYQTLLYNTKDHCTTITLNRPDRLNAWTAQMQSELKDAVITAGNDKNVRCIILTGAGRGFCAGADMDSLQAIGDGQINTPNLQDNHPDDPFPDAPGPDVSAYFSKGRFGYFYSCPKPIIAMINGPCAGIGLVLAMHADMRFAASEAKITTAFAKLGLIAEHGLSWILPRLVGEGKALDMLFTARVVLGEEAERIGLVNKAVPGEALAAYVEGVARDIVEQISPQSIAIAKRQVRAAYAQSFTEALAIADSEMAKSLSSSDFKEGVEAFTARRKPNFQPL